MDEITLLLQQFEKNLEDLAVQRRILDMVRQQNDATELIQKIMKGCSSKLEKKGSFTAFGISFDFIKGKSFEASKQLESSPGLLGKLHSEHLYFAAKCIGCAKSVDNRTVDGVTGLLLKEFDIEATYPRGAINAFGDMGDRAIPTLMQYMKDSTKETFSREDAALALGKIGSDQVVKELAICLAQTEYDDKAMPIYALGATRNPKARQPIFDFLKKYPEHPKTWVAHDALAKLPS